ncbi:putative bifunctional diguanylate cyclase/phosphodiesterase [Rugamonas apoptosis]|uniref:EAL domain-containing protein n=1 Tax=Rugamonas apoptosis TaxID=2758570 RepID=A0A7W2F9R5_9BURK|nr:bifunctional diguanylate cyclase/phosphodiesterase [Rugamonas apoptosis]MBA5687772.1 EAL domain-containing protein [Rugamonas apoptosis]
MNNPVHTGSEPAPADKDGERTGTSARHRRRGGAGTGGANETTALLHLLSRLEVHQEELQAQNEELLRAYREVEHIKERYADFYHCSPSGFVSLDRDGKIIQINATSVQLLDRAADSPVGTRFDTFLILADRAAFRAMLAKVYATGAKQHCEVRLSQAGHLPRTVQIDAMLAPDGIECRAVIVDVTEQKSAAARLQLDASVFAYASEGIMITDADGVLIDVNNAFSSITGYSRAEALGHSPCFLQSGHAETVSYDAVWRAVAEHAHWSGELWCRRKDGSEFVAMLGISAVRDNANRPVNYVAIFTDITQLKQNQHALEHIAHFDALTGLPNRVLLLDRLQQALAQSQRQQRALAVVFLDLDGFKAVNDQHGHGVGDALLIACAARMKAALRDEDTIARLGGDEFVALLVDLEHHHEFESMVSRLLHAVSSPIRLDELTLQVTASIGVTLYPADPAAPDQLLRHADQAMYQAKLAGKNRYHLFDVEHDEALKSQFEYLQEVRLAVAEKQFQLYYQPKVNLRTGVVVGAEALLRWQHPRRGLLEPAQFITMIDDQRIGVELGHWVIDTALQQAAAWQQAGLNIPVSVNVCAHLLQQSDFVSYLADRLASYPRLKPNSLELEILESSAVEDLFKVSEVIHACHRIGIDCALDDFGTGYSSLAYLRHLPVKTLKIDRSFVRTMHNDPGDLDIVKGILGLAAVFHRQVIAEGVETGAVAALLQHLGCDLAQGFAIAPPMTAPLMAQWVAQRRATTTWPY